ncbi:putative glycine dehydrogenase (decarboxylating) subunit 1 [compost metagenome]
MELALPSPFFNEFVLKVAQNSTLAEVNEQLLTAGFIGGYDLGRDYPEFADHLLVAVTERRTKNEIDQFAKELEGILG